MFFLVWFVVFFFKQKTAYEMRISDWSSDVCSSDLPIGEGDQHGGVQRLGRASGPEDRSGSKALRQRSFVVRREAIRSVLPGAKAHEGTNPRISGGRLRRESRGREGKGPERRSEEHTSELQSLMRNSYASFCLK